MTHRIAAFTYPSPNLYLSFPLQANYHPEVGVCHFDSFITYVCIHK